jgi:hypothetical protein
MSCRLRPQWPRRCSPTHPAYGVPGYSPVRARFGRTKEAVTASCIHTAAGCGRRIRAAGVPSRRGALELVPRASGYGIASALAVSEHSPHGSLGARGARSRPLACAGRAGRAVAALSAPTALTGGGRGPYPRPGIPTRGAAEGTVGLSPLCAGERYPVARATSSVHAERHGVRRGADEQRRRRRRRRR